MNKVLKITGYKVVNTKDGQRTIVYGVLYDNIDKGIKGHQTHLLWINKVLDDNAINKDLYAEINLLGRLDKIEVKWYET